MALHNGKAATLGRNQRRRLQTSFIQVNLDHARLATGTFCECMVTGSFSLAAVLDPHRPSRKILHLPAGFGLVAVDEDLDAAVIYQQPLFDVCPIRVTRLVVGVYCQGRYSDFVYELIVLNDSNARPTYKP